MADALSFARDIRPLFRDIDVAHMKPAGLDLSSYAEVKAKAQGIHAAVAGKTMPPDPADHWTDAKIATFKSWMDQGCPP